MTKQNEFRGIRFTKQIKKEIIKKSPKKERKEKKKTDAVWLSISERHQGTTQVKL